MGVLDTYNNRDFGKNSAFNSGGSSGGGGGGGSFGSPRPTGYSSWRRVVDAYRQGLLNYNEAYNILVTQFNYTPNIAKATLGESTLEDTEFDDDTLLPKPEEEEEEKEEEKEIIPLTDNQRFLIIGIVVTAGLYGFIKK